MPSSPNSEKLQARIGELEQNIRFLEERANTAESENARLDKVLRIFMDQGNILTSALEMRIKSQAKRLMEQAAVILEQAKEIKHLQETISRLTGQVHEGSPQPKFSDLQTTFSQKKKRGPRQAIFNGDQQPSIKLVPL